MNEEEREAYYFFKEQRSLYNKWVADKTANELDVVLARYYNSLFEILDKQQEELEQEKEENRNKNIAIIEYQDLLEREQEKNKKLEEEVKCFRDSYKEARIEECDNYFLMNKVIDLMAKDIWGSDDWTMCKAIKSSEDCYADTLADGKFCGKDCIKEYYFKVAKGEEYKNKYCGGED